MKMALRIQSFALIPRRRHDAARTRSGRDAAQSFAMPITMCAAAALLQRGKRAAAELLIERVPRIH
jgi:hypothetical protein